MVSFKTIKLCAELGCKVRKTPAPEFKIGTITQPIETITSSVERTAPLFNIGAKQTEQTVSSFKIGTSSEIEQATQNMTGTTQLTEQNRRFVIGKKQVKPGPLPPQLVSHNSYESQTNIDAFCKDFKTRTKALGFEMELHIPDNWDLSGMTNVTFFIEEAIKSGVIPQDIKHVIMAHGMGLSENGTWVFLKSRQSVPQWISENIKDGKKCIVAVCEGRDVPLYKDRPAVGTIVQNGLNDPIRPAKIMHPGNNNIIGHFLRTEGVTYYK